MSRITQRAAFRSRRSLRPGYARRSRRQATTLVLSCLTLGVLASCAVNPVSKRPELVFMSEEKELEIGAKMAEYVRTQTHTSGSPELVEYVRDIGERLATVAPRQNIEYGFDVVVDPSYNAFALPGGHLFVNTGALLWFNSEDEMAAVLGHEIIHAAARHTVQRDVASKVAGFGAMATAIAGGILGGQAGGYGGQMLSSLVAAGLVSNYSRDQESEADVLGQIMMDKIGYDPFAAAESHRQILRHKRELLGAEPDDASWFSSHPGSRERIRTLEAKAAELTATRDVVPRRKDAYLDMINGMLIDEPAEYGVFLLPIGYDRHSYDDEKTLFLHYDMGFQLQYPLGWMKRNQPAKVSGSNGAMVIELEFHNKNPERLMDAPKDFLAERRKKREEAEEKKQPVPYELTPVGKGAVKLRKIRKSSYMKVTFAQRQGTALIYFIQVGKENVFRLTCMSHSQLFEKYTADCRNTAKTLRTLTPRNRARIVNRRLVIAEALPNEKLADLSARSGNVWNLELTAAVNGLDRTGDRLSEGQRIKVAIEEPYTGKPDPPAGEEGTESKAEPTTPKT